MVTCYAPDGTAHQKEPVDARECCEHCGYSMTPPEPVEEVPAAVRKSKRGAIALTDE